MENKLLCWWLYWPCVYSSIIATIISFYTITRHLLNYRKPYEQRLSIRILLLVPIFSVSCASGIIKPEAAQFYVDPIREFYEAFVIYTFFTFLTLLLGGERNIITVLSLNHAPTRHPIPLIGKICKPIDLSDPFDFLFVKKGILQYVWFKPFYCFGTLICSAWKLPKFEIFLNVFYNISVTWSLYSLALFWKCLYPELTPYKPWLKFLCVKLIIFASYWQSIIIQGLVVTGKLGTGNQDRTSGYVYKNGLLCIEMVPFAILHAVAFPWNKYTAFSIPYGARMKFIYALKDFLGCGHLIWDFKQTLFAGPLYYNYRNFDPEAMDLLSTRQQSGATMERLKHGLRFTDNGRNSYWVAYGSIDNNLVPESIEESWEDDIAGQRTFPEDPNYPVVHNYTMGHRYSRSMNDLRRDVQSRSSMAC